MIDEKHILDLKAHLCELETSLAQPDAAADQNQFRKLLKEHASTKKRLVVAGTYFTYQTTIKDSRELLDDPDMDDELKEMAREELEEAERHIEKAEKELMFMLLPPDPSEERTAMFEIRAGTGGDEAALFVGDLYRMYARYAEVLGFKMEIFDLSHSSVGGYKEVGFSIAGDDAYKVFRYESGTHRVQRIPETESQGRIHTSAATVAVFPEADVSMDSELEPADLRVDLYCASGPGGQHVNTTQSAVRITHLPTGLVAQCQENRSQHRNRDQALSVLTARVADKLRFEEEAKQGADRRSMIGTGDRSGRVRTYNFPQNRLTDHRINLTLYSLDRVMEGDMQELVDSLRDRDVEDRLKAELEIKGSE